MKSYASTMVVICIALMLTIALRGNRYASDILILVCLHGAIALSWNLAAGFAGLLSLGHSLFVGIGAYAVALAVGTFGVNFWFAAALGLVIAAVAAAGVGALCFRYGVKGYYFAIATLAFSEIAFFLVSSAKAFGRSDGIMLPRQEDGWLNMSFNDKWPYALCAIALLGVTLLVSTWLLQHRAGSYWRAIRDNEEAAEALGVRVFAYKMMVFVVSAVLSAAAGAMYAGYVGFIDPRSVLGAEVSVQALVFSIVGGLGLVWGPLLGAALLLPLGEALRIWIGGGINGLAIMLYALVLIVLSLVLPQGVGGWLVERRARRTSVQKEADEAVQPMVEASR